jgi:predicted MFS family arabinose efflux permease
VSSTPSMTTVQHGSAPHAAALTALAGLIAMAAALGIGRFVYTPILPPMADALGLTKSASGLIASANFMGYLAGALLAATPFLRGSRRNWLLGSLTVSALTTGAMGLANSLLAFLALRLVGGIASALVLILASALVLERLAEMRRAGLSPLHFAGVGTGIAISAVVVALLVRANQSWQVLWLASGALSLAATAAVAVLLPPHSDPPHRVGPQVRSHLGDGLVRLIVAYGLFGFGYVITATFLVAVVRSTASIRSFEPVIWVVVGLAACPSVALWTRIAARRGIPLSFAIACMVESVGVLASVVWSSPLGIFVAAILLGGTFMGLTALGLMRARALAAGDPRRTMASMTVAFGLGQIIGPTFAGIVFDRTGDFTLPSFAAAGALLLAAALLLVDAVKPR